VEPLRIRSYRVVFRLERRVHRLGQWRVPLPHGLPLAGIGHFVLGLGAVLLLGRLPGAGALLSLLPAPARYALLPAGAAYLLSRWRPDGRAPHRAAWALVRLRASPRRRAALRAALLGRTRLADLSLAPDASGARLVPARVRGRAGEPVRLLLGYPCRTTRRGRAVRVEQSSARPLHRPAELALGAGERAILGRRTR
jgi:hypothetical protein